jgi:hypothetical protein
MKELRLPRRISSAPGQHLPDIPHSPIAPATGFEEAKKQNERTEDTQRVAIPLGGLAYQVPAHVWDPARVGFTGGQGRPVRTSCR